MESPVDMGSDDEEEDTGRRRLLGFMFGNVDASGDVDADYLDEDAREHLAALADQLGPSLADLDLLQSPSTAAEQDNGGAEEALGDHGGGKEQIGGPEADAATGQGDRPSPNQDFFMSDSSANHFTPFVYVLDEEEGYDVDDGAAEESQMAEDDPPSGFRDREDLCDGGVLLPVGPLGEDAHDVVLDAEDFEGEPVALVQEPAEPRKGTDLPVLCVENGMEILRFSEIFGVHEPLKKVGRRDHHRNTNSKANNDETMDVVDTIEDDEETFLKSVRHGPVVARHRSSVQGDCGDVGGGKVGSQTCEHGRDSCIPGQPMKERMAGLSSPRFPEGYCSGFYPLDQQDWEDKIVWGSSPATSHGSPRSCVMSEHDSDTCVADAEVGEVASSDYSGRRSGIEPDVDHSLVSLAVSGQPFVSRRILEQTGSQTSAGLTDDSWQQVLRSDPSFKGSGLEAAKVESNAAMERLGKDAAARCLKILSLQNNDLLDGCWMDQIIWDPSEPVPKPKLVLDHHDEQMSFEALEQNHIGQVSSHADAGAIIPYYRMQTPLEDSFDHSSQQVLPSVGFDIANDEFYLDWLTSQQSGSHAKRRWNHFVKVIHSTPTLKLQTMKPKLSNKEIANFHRPKALWYPRENEFASKMQGALCTQGSIKIILSLGGKTIKLHLDVKETLGSIKSRLSKKLKLKLPEKVKIFYSGKELEDDKSLAIQNVKPNSLLHIVRSKIHLWPTAQLLPSDNESLFPPGAFRRKTDLSLKDGHVFLMEYCEERPLLLGNIGMGARLCTYYRKSAIDDGTALPPQNRQVLGNVLTLDPGDESPFLGDLSPGCSQPSLETNMYRAPLFLHKLSSSDYLLVRSANGMLSLRRINKICVVGQQEPHVEVISPRVSGVRKYCSKRLLVHVYREFYAKQRSGLHPCIQADELSLQFPSLTEALLRKRLKNCADLQRGPNGRSFWVKKHDFHIPSEQEIRRILAPEDVCSYESMQAGLYHLKHLGIGRLRHPICLSPKLRQLPYEAGTLATASHIERELLLTPWNLSSSFVACVGQVLRNIHSLEITGAGDPSGCGLGFSYIRATWPTSRIPLPSTTKRKRATAVRVGSTSARADAFDNLSKLNSLEQEAAFSFRMDATTLGDSEPVSYLLRPQARRKCQEIWDRQVQSLANDDVSEFESSSEVGSDLDPFAVDLENLLDLDELVEGQLNLEHRNEVTGVEEGQQMGRHLCQVQREEGIEDEEAEAALIRRWLDGNDDIRIMKDDKLSQVTKVSSRSFTSKNAMQNKELQKIPIVKNLHLSMKVAYDSNDVHAGLVKMQNKAVEDGQEIVDKKELTDKPRRQIFACGACGQMGHMKTNKNCPKYREELQSRDRCAGENSEGSDKAEIDVPGRTLQLKFRYVLADKHQQSGQMGPHYSDIRLTTTKETDTKPITKVKEITETSCNTKSEKQEEVQKSPLVLRLSTHQKISFKPPKDVNNVEQRTQGAVMEQDNEFMDARKFSKLASKKEQNQPSEWLAKERETSKSVEQRNFFGEAKRNEKMAEERIRTRGQTPLRIGHKDAERDNTKKENKRKSKPVSISSYSKEYKTSRKVRRMHDRDRAAKGQNAVELGCHVTDYSLLKRHRRRGEVLLSNILENIVNSLREHKEISYLFMKPVSKKEAPDYFDIIKHPMDLATIKEKVRRMEYKSREDFRRDVWQINFNAHKYNDDRSPGIALLADQLLEICDHLLSQNSTILTEAEAGIEM